MISSDTNSRTVSRKPYSIPLRESALNCASLTESLLNSQLFFTQIFRIFVTEMNFIFSKYKTSFSTFLIGVYLLSLLAGILHFHHIEISEIKYFNEQTNNNVSNYLLQSDTRDNCIIQQNLSKIQTALVFNNCASSLICKDEIFIQRNVDHLKLKKLYLSSNLLRAPPTFS